VATVDELVPGDLVTNAETRAVVVAVVPRHPLWSRYRLVIWRLIDAPMERRGWSHDALAGDQYVGECAPATEAERRTRLAYAMLHPESARGFTGGAPDPF